jgi:hypothetical protein
MFEGLRVARVRVIFQLPPHIGTFLHPLAYVHWYTPLTTLDPATAMYQITPSTRNHLPNSEVISVDRIWRGCALIPQFGSASVPVSWTRGDPLDLAPKYYLGRHLDNHLFREYEKEMGL